MFPPPPPFGRIYPELDTRNNLRRGLWRTHSPNFYSGLFSVRFLLVRTNRIIANLGLRLLRVSSLDPGSPSPVRSRAETPPSGASTASWCSMAALAVSTHHD
jgi:hypothetical protein